MGPNVRGSVRTADIARWVSVIEVAEHLGVKQDTIYKWLRRKEMPAHKVGRLWKFRIDEVDAWVRSGGATEAYARNHFVRKLK